MRVSIGKCRQTDLVQIMQSPLLGLAPRQGFRRQQREHHVLLERFPGWQLVELLEHHHAVWPRGGDGLALQADLPFTGGMKTGHSLEQGRLAASRRSKQDETVGRIDFKADLMSRPHHTLRRAVFKADLVDRQQGWPCCIQVAGRVALHRGIHYCQLPCNGFASWKK